MGETGKKKNVHAGHRQRLKTEFLARPDSFPDHKALELLLFYANPRSDTNPLAHALMDRFGSLAGVLDASPAALGLASNEVITEFMVVFGVVPANFRQVETPQVYCNVVSWLTGGTQFVNQADTGGVYNGQWIMATSRWVTKVYKPAEPLPRTGY